MSGTVSIPSKADDFLPRKEKSVEVKLELGHRAVMRDKATEQGFTHDWTVFVRGVEGNSIECFVEKVVFHLHESFPKPKRVIKEPPYSVSESGYAGFMMPIDVYFRTKEEPKKVTFKYDLYLRLEVLPVSNIRIEKLTFQNPSDDFRSKLLRAGGLAGALSGSATGGSASLSTQACAPPPPPPIDDHQSNHGKPSVIEKKPRSHVPCKEIKSNQPPVPKPSQPFTDIFGAPIRTKNSPDSSSVKSKDPGHSSQIKTKNTSNSSSSSSSGKEGKPSSKESHKSKEGHYSSKESRHSSKEAHHSVKDSQPLKDTHHFSKEALIEKDPHHLPKDSHSLKESHHTIKESHHKVKEHHSKEGHKKDNHHSSKEGKASKESRPSKDHSLKDSKSSKSGKSDKELHKSGVKRPIDSHNFHGNAEKKKKSSPALSESSEKSSSLSKHKIKESKEKTEKQRVKSLANSVKKEEEKPKHKGSPIAPELVEAKEMLKPKLNSPKPPSPVVKPLSPLPKAPSPDSHSLDSSSDESRKSFKAHYSSPGSPASSISDSSLQGSKPLDFMAVSYTNVISPLSDEEPVDENLSPPPKRKVLSPVSDMDESSQESKPLENRPMPKLNKKQHTHHKSSKPKSENFHRGNGSINSDISMHHSPSPENQNIAVNNSAYREELLEMQRIIMSSNDGKLLQGIVDVIEKTGKYEVTNTTFDFDLCTLDYAIIQEIKRCLSKNCDNCF